MSIVFLNFYNPFSLDKNTRNTINTKIKPFQKTLLNQPYLNIQDTFESLPNSKNKGVLCCLCCLCCVAKKTIRFAMLDILHWLENLKS